VIVSFLDSTCILRSSWVKMQRSENSKMCLFLVQRMDMLLLVKQWPYKKVCPSQIGRGYTTHLLGV